MLDFLYTINSFIERGGDVLIVIFIVALAMWSVILDKLFYHFFVYKKKIYLIKIQNKQLNKMSFLSTKNKIENGMNFIKISIMVAPLLGLLGTVTGMIEVFDTISILGNSDARAMSSGISQATIPTMVGMSVALSGMIFKTYLEQVNKKKLRFLSEKLHIEFKGKRRK
ncbi:MotA/TolQ/ExbB proton channel family protein [Sulfurimonas sp.]|uniref:MotA/TolQ/ExbB proton channel family protein n=1 Tax=Sulfurimonas sp. TaxID=2022749 RepID=UPI002B46D9A6|nr:MotA/TolQ/ExbB proton channel family protein [Sulfurimonas sp.]